MSNLLFLLTITHLEDLLLLLWLDLRFHLFVNNNDNITEYPQLEGIHGDHHAQPWAPHGSAETPALCLSSVQTPPELQQLGAVPFALCSSFRAHRPPVQTISVTPSCPSYDTAQPCCCHRLQNSVLILPS